VILRRLLLWLIAAAALSAAAVVVVVALAFAVYAAAAPRVGPAWAAAIVALTGAGCLALTGFCLTIVRQLTPPPPPIAETVVERLFAFVRAKPLVSLTTAIAAGLMSVRDPKYLGAALRAFLDGSSRSP
jgi:hypothetical protein